MKKLVPIFLIVFGLCCCDVTAQTTDTTKTNIFFADPTIFHHKGIYYLYGTVGGNANNGFLLYTSTDINNWQMDTTVNSGYGLKKGDSYGNGNFWAPQVFASGNRFYMAYTADEHIAIAKAASPAGPFKQEYIKALDAPVKQIDPFVFIDEDGKKYLYHVRLQNGNRIFVAQLKEDFSAIDSATLKECITATGEWENTANSKWPVTEGPTVIKHNGLYYLFYTANDFRNPDYAVGYATSKSPFGPWEKYAGNPIISRKNIGENGTGHGDFLIGAGNNLTYVFHTHFSNSKASPRKTAIINMKFLKDKDTNIDKVAADTNSFHYITTNKK